MTRTLRPCVKFVCILWYASLLILTVMIVFGSTSESEMAPGKKSEKVREPCRGLIYFWTQTPDPSKLELGRTRCLEAFEVLINRMIGRNLPVLPEYPHCERRYTKLWFGHTCVVHMKRFKDGKCRTIPITQFLKRIPAAVETTPMGSNPQTTGSG
nr:PREDICTED: uncharacterized protein LOC109036258 [Bemisia tabaci]